jgi:imidazolonepropionase-like amidohydrolase
VGANVIVSPSLTVTNATLVINNGKVVSVSPAQEAASGSRIWDLEGYTIYPGFIDPYYVISPDGSPVRTTPTTAGDHDADHKASGHWNFYGMPGDELDPGDMGPGSSLSTVHPEV